MRLEEPGHCMVFLSANSFIAIGQISASATGPTKTSAPWSTSDTDMKNHEESITIVKHHLCIKISTGFAVARPALAWFGLVSLAGCRITMESVSTTTNGGLRSRMTTLMEA